jgi:predicted flap endonuclease-1-like 5' DNA nuclease
MLEPLSQIVLYLLIGGVIGIVIGYMLGKNSCRDEDCQPPRQTPLVQDEIPQTPPNKDPKPTMSQPQLLSTAREGGKDNLQRIKGIGVVIEKVLNEKGIYHFDQIASWSETEVAWIDRAISFPGRAKRENWIAQAKALAQDLQSTPNR